MGKSTKKKNKKVTAPKANIQELSISRDGGQIALRGYSYQFLYSCYLILSSSNPSNFFQLEGIEDIDCIMQKNGSNDITHIQLKYSVNKQDASFLTDVLKNFLEAYLLDQNRFFKLVYDFPVAKGHLSKIFASKLDEKSRTHWAGVISNIKKNNPSWNWSVYDFDKFISHLSFEKIEKSILATEIEKTLIRIYEINTDNVSLFANSIKILCFEKMEQRAYVTKAELDSKIQSVKIDISKGPQNPAHSWIRKLDYSNKNIEYLCRLRERIPTCCLQETYVYIFCDCLYRKMRTFRFDGIKDITSYTSISEWIYNINPEWNVSAGFSLDDLWSKPEKLTLECVSTLMYLSYCGNREKYMEFVERNLKSILTYLKQWTRSHRVFIDSEKKAIHIEYILRLHNIKTGNEQSVSRLKFLCKALPIFDLYCADALKPTVDLLSAYPVPDDAHKEMPIKNIVIMFHQNLTSLWNKTIMSNYEFDTATEWLNYWFDVREHICLLADKCCACIYKLLGGKPLGSLAGEVDQLREEFALITTGEKRYPKEDRPFEEKATVPERLGKIKSKYFQSIQNFMNQFAGFLIKNEQKQRLAMVNLTIAQSALVTMQNYFAEIAIDFSFQERQLTLCVMETQNIERLIMCCSYYQTHSPNKYFNKYQISNWYDGHCRDERKIVEDGLSELESKYSIHFPDQIYTIDMLSYYPIIVGNFDMASESNLTEWLLGCIAFADAPFDYLVILSANESEEIDSTALQFPRRMLVDVKKAIESENHSLLDKLVPPYPVNVTAQMLDCFSEKYDLPEKKVTDVDELPIGYIAEELWIYSKSVELLTEPEDACYLAAQTQDIQLNITEMLCLLKNKLPVKDVDWLIEICDNVFSGEKFDDIMFNNVIEHFIQKKIEQ